MKSESDQSQSAPDITFFHLTKSYRVKRKHFFNNLRKTDLFGPVLFSRINIPSIFSEHAVQAFIEFINTSQVNVKMNKVCEFIALADLFGCDRLSSKALKIIFNVPKLNILAQYIVLLSNNVESESVEKFVVQSMQTYLKFHRDILIKLPIPKILRLLQQVLYFDSSNAQNIDMSDIATVCCNLVHKYGISGLDLLTLIDFNQVSDEALSCLAWEVQFLELTPEINLILHLNKVRISKNKELKKIWNYLYISVLTPNKDEPKLAVAKMLQTGPYLPQNHNEYTSLIGNLARSKNPEAQYLYSQLLLKSHSKNDDDEDDFSSETFKSILMPLNNSVISETNSKENLLKLVDDIDENDKNIIISGFDQPTTPTIDFKRRMSTSNSSPTLNSITTATPNLTPPSQSPLTQEERDSLRYLRNAADQNYDPAIIKLCEIMMKDRSLLKTRGMKEYIQKAVLLGNSTAEFLLAQLYRDGIGVKQDLELSRELYSISAYHQNYSALIESLRSFKTYDKRLFFLLVSTGNLELVKIYLTFDISCVHGIDFESWSVAHYAVIPSNDITVLQFLHSKYKIDLQQPTITGAQPIHIACLSGNIKAVKFLIEKLGPQIVHTSTFKEELPIHMACKSGNHQLVNLLLKEFNCKDEVLKPTISGWLCIHYACDTGSKIITDHLIRCDPPKNSLKALTNDRETPLHLACKSGFIDLVTHLMKFSEISKHSVKILTNTKASILHYAYLSGNMKLIRQISTIMTNQLGPSVTRSKTTMNENIFHFACLGGNRKSVEYIAKNKIVDIYEKTMYNETGLHYACKNGNEKVVIYLLQNYDFDLHQTNIIFFFLLFLFRFIFL